MENSKRMCLNYEFRITANDSEEYLNSSFSRGVIWVAYAGKNRNGCYISKETFEQCVESIKNVPVVCHYLREDKDYGGHDVEVFKDDDTNEIKLVNVTHPIGVVPSDANHWWETVTETNGTEHEYLCVDVLLWKREEGFQKVYDDGFASESMEISINSGETVGGIYYIKDFEFTALCLLGDNVEPCYESASIQLYSLDEFKIKLSQMFDDYKNELTEFAKNSSKQINSNKVVEGGKGVMSPEVKAVFEKYGFQPENVKLDVENMSLEDIDTKLNELKCSLNSQVREQLASALSDEKFVEEWGDESYEVERYVLFDYDAELAEAYYYDRQDNWNIYGFTYSFNGDVAVVDKNSKKKKKCALVDFDEGSSVQNFDYSNKIKEVFAKVEDSLNTKISELEDFKNNTLSQKRAEDIKCIFEKFSILDGQEAFENLKANTEGMSVEAIEDKCYSIKGRTELTFSKAKESGNLKFSVDPNVNASPASKKDGGETREPYGGLFKKYGVTE